MTPAPSPTAPLFGSYEADVTRPARLAGHWVLEFDGNGTVLVTPPDGYAGVVSGTLFTADASRLRTNLFAQDVCADLGNGEFSWTRQGARLALAPSDEPCAARSEVPHREHLGRGSRAVSVNHEAESRLCTR